jgi:hypothetical protein
MKKQKLLVVLGIACAIALPLNMAGAQSSQKTLAATLDTYVFPEKGQDAAQQSKDEAECYDWAVSNTGSDPFDLQKKSAQSQAQADAAKQQAAQASQGAGAKGAVGGAAVGAIVGEIADDDAGKGAAYGAAAGAIAARRTAKKQTAQVEAQAEQQAQKSQAATAESIEKFKKAFSTCLEAKNYKVKY